MKEMIYDLLFVACYSWEMALKTGLDASCYNMKDSNGIQEKSWEVFMIPCLINYAQEQLYFRITYKTVIG
jgi:hypothetical protein